MTDDRVDERSARIRAEYREMPGLKLTAAQASRFWNLARHESDELLEALTAQGVLLRTRDGHYVLLSASSLR
jgi:histidinol-phosphate/aromatic aminotransferase/cobyric acid decarboxylase-like protein